MAHMNPKTRPAAKDSDAEVFEFEARSCLSAASGAEVRRGESIEGLCTACKGVV